MCDGTKHLRFVEYFAACLRVFSARTVIFNIAKTLRTRFGCVDVSREFAVQIIAYRYLRIAQAVPQWNSTLMHSVLSLRCVGSYGDKNVKKPIMLIGKGTDGLKGIRGLLESDIAAYALLRVVSLHKLRL